jgi:hypothetical protein
MLEGWSIISRWWKTESDNTQGESFRVMGPPRPDSLPVNAAIYLTKSVPVSVTVKITQSESGIRAGPKKTPGLPKPARFMVPPVALAGRTRIPVFTIVYTL